MEQVLQQLSQLTQTVTEQQQQIAQQAAQFTELQQQLVAALTRATQAETERTQALNLSAAAQQAAATAATVAAAATPLTNSQPTLVDTKALGQPPKLRRRDSLPNWPEWKHKVFTFVNAYFKQNGKRVVEAMRWAEQQRKQLFEENLYSDERVLAWSSIFGDEVHSPTYFIKTPRKCLVHCTPFSLPLRKTRRTNWCATPETAKALRHGEN